MVRRQAEVNAYQFQNMNTQGSRLNCKQGNGWTLRASAKCATGHVETLEACKLFYGIQTFCQLATFQATCALPMQRSICLTA